MAAARTPTAAPLLPHQLSSPLARLPTPRPTVPPPLTSRLPSASPSFRPRRPPWSGIPPASQSRPPSSSTSWSVPNYSFSSKPVVFSSIRKTIISSATSSAHLVSTEAVSSNSIYMIPTTSTSAHYGVSTSSSASIETSFVKTLIYPVRAASATSTTVTPKSTDIPKVPGGYSYGSFSGRFRD